MKAIRPHLGANNGKLDLALGKEAAHENPECLLVREEKLQRKKKDHEKHDNKT
jgi:hypothetical protein